MFSINGTLVLQIGHFCIAYYILKKLLLAPAIAIIEQENRAHEELEQRIAQLAQNLSMLEQEKQLIWQEAYAHFAAHIPHPAPDIKPAIPSLNIIHYPPAQQEDFEKALTSAIIRKVEHG
jgi:hypothetical protein